MIHKTKKDTVAIGFSDELKRTKIPIVTAVTAIDSSYKLRSSYREMSPYIFPTISILSCPMSILESTKCKSMIFLNVIVV